MPGLLEFHPCEGPATRPRASQLEVELARLQEGIARVHAELIAAREATVEGWMRALHLRDAETEGHCQRVTEMTVRLARYLGEPEAELVYIRLGARLHDIGKMAIPDSILLKPETLSDEEWAVMMRHPTYAYEMLWPIESLRPALDIPYAHHEKWNGSGYPRGLSAEEIPWAARIFAAVDIWDALRSKRTYRDAWPDEKVRSHLSGLSGKHLDPQVVEAFLAILSAEGPGAGKSCPIAEDNRRRRTKGGAVKVRRSRNPQGGISR